jgi:hypothetical protein
MAVSRDAIPARAGLESSIDSEKMADLITTPSHTLPDNRCLRRGAQTKRASYESRLSGMNRSTLDRSVRCPSSFRGNARFSASAE